MKLKDLKNQYELVCNEYVRLFCKKQEMEFYGWAAQVVGEVACCNDFYFNFSDIVLDVNTMQPKSAIIDWYYNDIEINYYSYTKGLRVKDIKK